MLASYSMYSDPRNASVFEKDAILCEQKNEDINQNAFQAIGDNSNRFRIENRHCN